MRPPAGTDVLVCPHCSALWEAPAGWWRMPAIERHAVECPDCGTTCLGAQLVRRLTEKDDL